MCIKKWFIGGLDIVWELVIKEGFVLLEGFKIEKIKNLILRLLSIKRVC